MVLTEVVLTEGDPSSAGQGPGATSARGNPGGITRRSAVLGFVVIFVLAFLPLGGCSESLFGARHGGSADDDGGGGGGDDAGVTGVTGCTEPCNADAAADFNGTIHGAQDRWRYLDDHRDRTWKPMAVGAQVMTGADPGNHITTCAAHPSAPACGSLPGALLVSAAGASTADPAIELTVATAQVIDVKLKAFVPNGQGDQTIRLYRNSREDVLFTDNATAGVTLEHAITLDALPGDRFLVAVVPVSSSATDIGLDLAASANSATFPSTCKLAVPFATSTGNTTQDLCGGPTFNFYASTAKNGKQPQLMPAVFPEQGKAATIHSGEFFERGMNALQLFQWPQNLTVQFWFRPGQLVDGQFNSILSDWDSGNCGGIGVEIVPVTSLELHVHMCETTTPAVKDADIVHMLDPGAGWQFLRVVRSNGAGVVCLNGREVERVAVTPGQGTAGNLLSLGRQDSIATTPAYFDGQIDDVRVFSGALPCD